MTHTTNNPCHIDFTLRQETREAGLVTRMYRNQNSIFVEVSIPVSPESNDRILRSFFLTVTPGKLHEAPKQLRNKAKEELAVYNASEEDILIIASHVSAEIPNNIDKLRDLEAKENKNKDNNKKKVHSGKDNWGRGDDKPDFSKFNHNQILEMRGTKYVSYANKVTKTRIPADDPILTKIGNLQNLGEDERWQLYEAFEQLQFKQQNKILYEAVIFKSSNADFNDDRLTEEIADKPPPPAGSADDSKIPGDTFLEDAKRYVTKFVYYDPDSDSFKTEDFVMKDDKPVFPVPTSGASSIPYEFFNIEHLNMFYGHKVRDNQTTITSLFVESLGIFKHFNKQPKAVTIAWSAAMVVSHLADLFPVIPYFGGIGIPGSGKSSMAETALFCSYRGMKLTNPNAAQATRVFGNTEPGQYTLVVDEADKIDKDSDFMPMLKSYVNGTISSLCKVSLVILL
ncbi:MAG: hypothetical protein WBP64_15260 [Nitrososphaeraceae archaeon]